MSRIAIVTGASRGIGAAIARRLASRSWRVCGIARNAEALQAAVQSWAVPPPQDGANTHAGHAGIACDVAGAEKNDEFRSFLAREGTNVCALVHAAGITHNALLLRTKDEDVEALIRTNLVSTMTLTRAVLKPMLAHRRGSIVSIGSVVARTGNEGQALYAATKAALVGFSASLAKEVGPRGIRCNVVEPGFIGTEMTEKHVPPERFQQIVAQTSLRRIGNADEVAALVEFLVSDASSYITGQTIRVCGGLAI